MFYFWPGAISIIEQQHDKTISVPSKDSDQVGHLTSLNVTVIFYNFEPIGPRDSLDPN